MAGPISKAIRRRAGVLGAIATAAAVGGCSFVPRSKLDECHRLSQTLRADNTRLKDVTAELRSQNQELTQRAVDDARKLAAQDEAVERLETSVAAYQKERDELAAAFESIKRQVRLAASAEPSASLPERLRDFAAPRANSGWAFDPSDGGLTAPADRLFEPGTARLTTGGAEALQALTKLLPSVLPKDQAVEVTGRPAAESEGEGDGVRQAGFSEGEGDDEPAGHARFLASARAAKVREALTSAGIDPGRVRLVAPSAAKGATASVAEKGGRLELRPVPAALDSAGPAER
ncbi:MAG: OmpA family protein [Isosphaeraceae bacterium]